MSILAFREDGVVKTPSELRESSKILKAKTFGSSMGSGMKLFTSSIKKQSKKLNFGD